MYEKITWKNHIVTNPDTYTMTNNADNTVTLEPAPGTIIQQGTQVNAENLNQMDNAIYLLSQIIGDEELDSVLANTIIESLNEISKPNYTEASNNQNLVSGESYKKAFGKISKAIRSLISHLSASNPHGITCDTIGAAVKSNFDIKTALKTWKGLSFYFYKQGRLAYVIIAGTLTENLDISESYTEYITCPEGFEIAAGGVMYVVISSGIIAQFNMYNSGIQLGYARKVSDNSTTSLLSGTNIYASRMYITR